MIIMKSRFLAAAIFAAASSLQLLRPPVLIEAVDDDDVVIAATVTIVGAGPAGISAAQVFNDAGIDFVLVEAQDRIGGRFKKFTGFGDASKVGEYTIEEGANWIQGPYVKGPNGEENDPNPLWMRKTEYDIRGSFQNFTNYGTITDFETGKGVPDQISKKWYERMEKALRFCDEKNKEMWAESDWTTWESIDITVEQCLRESGYYEGLEDLPKVEQNVANFMEWNKIDFNYAQPASKITTMLSFPFYGERIYLDYFIVDQRGFSVWMEEIVENEFDPSQIYLSSIVESINATTDDGKKVTVRTKDGTKFVSEYVISTLPLGVMQKGDVQFIPEFTEERKDGINGMLMGNYAKLTMQFESPFWEEDQEILLTASDDLRSETNVFPWAININHQKWLPGSNILSFHVVEKVARTIESQPIETTVEDALRILRMKYGTDAVTPVLDVSVTNWTHNPYSYGSYSDWPIGYSNTQHQAMKAAFGMDGKRKTVYFAGEATTYDASGNQAIISGQQVAGPLAKRILRMKENNDESSEDENSSNEDSEDNTPIIVNEKCVDNPDYTYNGYPKKNCKNWIADASFNEKFNNCNRKDEFGVLVKDECRFSCNSYACTCKDKKGKIGIESKKKKKNVIKKVSCKKIEKSKLCNNNVALTRKSKRKLKASQLCPGYCNACENIQ